MLNLPIKFIVAAAFSLMCSSVAPAQTTRVIKFNTRDKGEEKTLAHWGVDATWLNHHNAYFTKKNAEGLIDYVRVGFFLNEPYKKDGSLSKGQIEKMEESLKFVHKIDPKMPVKLSPNNLHKISDWYKNKDGTANVERWYNVMEKTKDYYESKGNKVVLLEPFNEPDWKKWNMGEVEDLDKILKKCEDWDVPRAGPSTLSTTPVERWYSTIKKNVEYGATHTLGGTMEEYINFIRQTKREKKKFMNPEAHSLVEAIVGIEEGIDSVCWWDQATTERSAFMRACKGKRIAYEAVPENWSAACVYKDPKGRFHGFASTNERKNGVETVYHFICEDKDVTYYMSDDRKNGVFRKRGEVFEVKAKVYNKNHTKEKESMTKWFTMKVR